MNSIPSQNPMIDCLELVGQHCEDPTPLVYERLFNDFPEVQAQFILDTDDSAKGQMLFQFIECVLDHIGDQHFAGTFIQSEIVNHEGLGIPHSTFTAFFRIVRDVFRTILGSRWTNEFEISWQSLIDEFDDLVVSPS